MTPDNADSFNLSLDTAKKVCPNLYKIMQELGVTTAVMQPLRHSKAVFIQAGEIFHLNFKKNLDTPEELLAEVADENP